MQPLRSTSITETSSLIQVAPPPCSALVLSLLWVLHLSFSLNIRTTGSHVPHKSLDQVHVTFMPDAAQAVNRFPLSLSWRPASTPVLTPSLIFRHLISDSLALISLILTWHGLLPCLFLNAHHKRLFTYAAWGGLKPAPVSRLRGAYPHLLCSCTHF